MNPGVSIAALPAFWQDREEPWWWSPGAIDMSHEEMLARISVEPAVCFGKPCIRGTRIWVSLILENLADGLSEAQLLQAYPQLKSVDIRAALAFGAEATRERVVELAPLA